MKCHYHPDREPVGMCVACGHPICTECKVVLKDRLYCNECVAAGRKSPEAVFIIEKKGSSGARASFARPSLYWWLLPMLFGLVGGVIASLVTREKAPLFFDDYLFVGVGVTVLMVIMVIIAVT